MAHCQENRAYRDVLVCPICLGLLTDPVLVHCDRNFCRSCIVSYRQSQQSSTCCPQCGEDTPDLCLQPNRVLRDVAEKIRKEVDPQEHAEESRHLCSEHREKLSLVCETDGMLICPVCRDSMFHKGHKFRQRKEFIITCKTKGASLLNSLNQKVVALKTAIQKQEHEVEDTKDISCWRGRFTGETPTAISQNVCLGTFKGPLQYKLWREMKDFIHPAPAALTLDPRTANPWLLLSQDLTSMTVVDYRLQVPDDLARFDVCLSVLATEGFVDGAHYWEVEVRGKSKWDVGVAKESINRKGEIVLKPENGYLVVSLSNGNEYCALTSPEPIPLPLTVQPNRIGIYLDYNGGQVSFYDAGNMSHLYTFRVTFTERMFPFFCPCLNDTGDNGAPLSIHALH
ncbi:nuclear factor 7, ovary-like isoform X4 [Hemitrygon akajei]|uniref:nuclear factor 7, ovary-like isoform X4 n=1 Tax=Hemitrygon akajei TaxID=2704970 RepID=UPI003BF9B137